jgi:O-methyltransferase involved in polyketide biosynthesis
VEREKVTLTGAPETLLATLYGRALDSRARRSVLHDEAAARAVERIDYDFRRTGMTATTAAGVALRGRQLDAWTREFLGAHPEATVLHLGCGLDTRAQRLAAGPSVRWVDLDHPEVVALRERLLPPPGGDYHLVGGSVTDDGWLEAVPADRPTVAVFEGLTMYLRAEDGRRLIERITDRFPSGQLLFDCYGTIGIRLQKLVTAVRRSGATLQWGIDDPRELEAWHDGLVLLDALRSVDMPGLDLLPRTGRIQMRLLALLPKLRDVGRILRYRF